MKQAGTPPKLLPELFLPVSLVPRLQVEVSERQETYSGTCIRRRQQLQQQLVRLIWQMYAPCPQLFAA